MDTKGNSVKKNMLFNTTGSLIYYVCQWLMSVLIVRISGYEDAGILSIAMSVTASPAIIGLFNVRSYQVSDINDQYSNGVYIRSRTFTNILSFVICAIMTFANGYTAIKAATIFVFMLYKISEGYADVFYGIEQKKGRLDIAGISLSIRGIGAIAFFVGVFMVTNNMLTAICAMTMFSFAIVLVYDWRITKKWDRDEKKQQEKVAFSEIKDLLITCLPLAIVAFLNNLSVNIPKIYLEGYFGSEVMGYYSSVASPTVVIQLAATTIFAPLVPILTEQYCSGKKDDFLHTIKRFSLLVAGLSAICLVGSKLLAHWGLVLLFTESIEPYVYLFVPIVWVSILIAVNACMFSVCTLLRVIKPQYIIGFTGVAVSFILSLTIVKSQSMVGVVWALVGSLVVQVLIQFMMVYKKVKRMNVEHE